MGQAWGSGEDGLAWLDGRAAASQLQDVVWGYDAHNDSAGSLLNRMRDYAHDLLGSAELTITFEAPAAARPVSLEARRAVYLV